MKTYFTGQGHVPRNTYAELPLVDNAHLDSPEFYTCSTATAAAVNTALHLGMPLLLTGEPGCGKSRLADRVSWEIGYPGEEPIKISIKSSSEASDLFYGFDTVGRFYAAQIAGKNISGQTFEDRPQDYIRYQGLGLAILRAKGRAKLPAGLCSDEELKQIPMQPQRSVVLIDEIDKAPREVPNDLLNEIEAMKFCIPELGILEPIQLDDNDKHFRPLVIITSNSERDLPEAFLRRCLYHHMEFPPFGETDKKSQGEVTVEQIVARRFMQRYPQLPPLITDGLGLCKHLRMSNSLSKPPSLAEIIQWLNYCLLAFADQVELSLASVPEPKLLQSIRNILLKNRTDHETGDKLYQDWLRTAKGGL